MADNMPKYLSVILYARPDVSAEMNAAMHMAADTSVRIFTSLPIFSGPGAFDMIERFAPQVVIVESGVAGYVSGDFLELRRKSKLPVILVGLAPAGSAEYENMLSGQLDAVYPLPVSKMLLDRIQSELPVLYEKAAASWNKGAWNDVAPSDIQAAVANSGGASWQRARIVVWSPKGGVGKTTVSEELAVTLAAIGGRNVALIDANMNGGHVRLRLNIEGKKNILTAASHYDMANSNESLRAELPSRYRDCMCEVPGADNLHVLIGIASPEQSRHPHLLGKNGSEFIRDFLAWAGRAYDFVIVDLGSSIGVGVHQGALTEAGTILVVATPDVTSLVDAEVGVHKTIVPQLGFNLSRFALAINQWRDGLGIELKDAADFARLPVIGVIPNNASGLVTRAGNGGTSFVASYAGKGDNSADVEATLSGFVALAGHFYPPIASAWAARSQRSGGTTSKKGGLLGLFGGKK